MSPRAFDQTTKQRAAIRLSPCHDIMMTPFTAGDIALPHGVLSPWPLLPDHA